MSRRRNQLKKFAENVQKKYGDRVVEFGVSTLEIPRVQTGSMSLDIALGGGLPVGRVTMFYGQKSSGKTTTAYRIAGLAQGLCANCLRPVDTQVVEFVDETTGEVEYDQEGSCSCYNEGLFEPIQYPDEKKDEFKQRGKTTKRTAMSPSVLHWLIWREALILCGLHL